MTQELRTEELATDPATLVDAQHSGAGWFAAAKLLARRMRLVERHAVRKILEKKMSEIYQMAPAGKLPILLLAPIALVVLGVFIMLVWTATSIGRGHVELNSQILKIAIPIYGRSIPITSLQLDSARVVDLTAEKNLSLKRRTNGIGLPNYAAGWFKLRNGEKALTCVTDVHKVLYLPTREGYSILLSVMEPIKMLNVLKGQVHS
jgi:hypothetical protein